MSPPRSCISGTNTKLIVEKAIKVVIKQQLFSDQTTTLKTLNTEDRFLGLRCVYSFTVLTEHVISLLKKMLLQIEHPESEHGTILCPISAKTQLAQA